MSTPHPSIEDEEQQPSPPKFKHGDIVYVSETAMAPPASTTWVHQPGRVSIPTTSKKITHQPSTNSPMAKWITSGPWRIIQIHPSATTPPQSYDYALESVHPFRMTIRETEIAARPVFKIGDAVVDIAGIAGVNRVYLVQQILLARDRHGQSRMFYELIDEQGVMYDTVLGEEIRMADPLRGEVYIPPLEELIDFELPWDFALPQMPDDTGQEQPEEAEENEHEEYQDGSDGGIGH